MRTSVGVNFQLYHHDHDNEDDVEWPRTPLEDPQRPFFGTFLLPSGVQGGRQGRHDTQAFIAKDNRKQKQKTLEIQTNACTDIWSLPPKLL